MEKNDFDPKLIEMLNQKKVFIFDFDGTIASSNSVIFKAMQKVCQIYGYNFTENDFLDVKDKPSNEYFEKMKQIIPIKLDYKKVIDQYNEACNEVLKSEKLECFEYVLKIFELFALKKTFVLASNNVESYLQERLKDMNIDKFFSKIFACGDEIKKNQIYTNTFGLLNAKPEECVVFEDAQKYVEQAKNAGITTVGILHTSNKNVLDADFLIDFELKKEKQS